jgi:hypothetical protein
MGRGGYKVSSVLFYPFPEVKFKHKSSSTAGSLIESFFKKGQIRAVFESRFSPGFIPAS